MAEKIAAELRERGHAVAESADDLPTFIGMAYA
jgi:hypothetical protein